MDTLGESVLGELKRVGPLSSVELAERLSQTVTAVQTVLLHNDEVFLAPRGGSDVWGVVSSDDMAQRLGIRRALRPWQVEAFQKWVAAGRTGVVEAVTGAGKTEVGIVAIAEARRRGVPAVILVPDSSMIEHWVGALTAVFTGVAVGTPDSSRALAVREQIVVTTITGLGKRHLTAFRESGLLIVDEMQRLTVADYTDSVFPRDEFTEKLGLTASYEWSNPQAERILRPYFGALISGCDYRRAVGEGILGKPLVLTVGVGFTPTERDEYDEFCRRIESAEKKLRDMGVDLAAGALTTAREIDSGSLVGEVAFLARELLDAEDGRRSLLGRATAKSNAAATVALGSRGFGRTSVFTGSHESSAAVAKDSRSKGIVAESIPDDKDPAFILGRYENGTLDLLATSRLLDEGIAVPQSEVGIVISPARSRSQMLQRMGRVVHSGAVEGRTAMVIVYVTGTIEDPEVGFPAKTFTGELFEIAALRRDLDPTEAAEELSSWFGKSDEVQPDSESDLTSQGDGVVPEESVWEPREAILDIFDELGGLATWSEIRELLPDLEVEDALMGGIPEITWMRAGDALIAAGGRSSGTIVERVLELDALARAHRTLATKDVTVDEVRSEWADHATILHELRADRLADLWLASGGLLSGSGTGNGIDLDGNGRQSDATSDLSSEDSPPEDSGVGQVAPALSPAIRNVVDQIESKGGRVEYVDGPTKSTLAVVGSDGRRRLARVYSGMGGNWTVSTRDPDLLQETRLHDAIIFLDRSASPEVFYIAPVVPYAKRARAVIEARTKGNPRERNSDRVSIESWVVQDGFDRWDLLGIGVSPAADTVAGPLKEETAQVEDSVESVPVPVLPGGVQWSSEGEVRVVMEYQGNKIVGFFDPETSELRVATAQGAPKLAGKTFRNPAVAAGTVKSTIANRTVFGIGFTDWVVDENTRETLEGFLSEVPV